MLFNSFAYAVFLPVVFAAYWLVKDRFRWILLIAASYFFYMCSSPVYGLLIFGVTAVCYLAARWMEGTGSGKRRKQILLFAVLACMAVLFFFKYLNFFCHTLGGLLGTIGIRHDMVTLHIVLPVGISFYTFQAMSYVIDVYRGRIQAEHHFGKFVAFISFFPQLVAGPIERSENLLSQIKEEHVFSYDEALYGMKLMLWGYYKKLVIADILSSYVQTVYRDPREHTGFSLVLASFFFALQIYCDFSGYSDIAVGTARLFGIRLMTNFKSPYFSRSIREFWSRWHISLSTWFRDYVYIPLGGNRVTAARHRLNLMVTFLVSGLWHGADWTFVIWGGIHGLGRILEDALDGRQKSERTRVPAAVRMLMVFVFCCFAWIFFVADSTGDAVYVITHCLTGITRPAAYLHSGFAGIHMTKEVFAITCFSILILAFYDSISMKEGFMIWLSRKKRFLQWAFYLMIGLMIVFLSKKGVASEFIYFQF